MSLLGNISISLNLKTVGTPNNYPAVKFVGPIASQYGAMGFEDSQSGFLLQKTIQKRLDVYCHPTRSLSYVLYVFV